jgi:hypothetical protein
MMTSRKQDRQLVSGPYPPEEGSDGVQTSSTIFQIAWAGVSHWLQLSRARNLPPAPLSHRSPGELKKDVQPRLA